MQDEVSGAAGGTIFWSDNQVRLSLNGSRIVEKWGFIWRILFIS